MAIHFAALQFDVTADHVNDTIRMLCIHTTTKSYIISFLISYMIYWDFIGKCEWYGLLVFWVWFYRWYGLVQIDTTAVAFEVRGMLGMILARAYCLAAVRIM